MLLLGPLPRPIFFLLRLTQLPRSLLAHPLLYDSPVQSLKLPHEILAEHHALFRRSLMAQLTTGSTEGVGSIATDRRRLGPIFITTTTSSTSSSRRRSRRRGGLTTTGRTHRLRSFSSQQARHLLGVRDSVDHILAVHLARSTNGHDARDFVGCKGYVLEDIFTL
jgi:hypothetical protein